MRAGKTVEDLAAEQRQEERTWFVIFSDYLMGLSKAEMYRLRNRWYETIGRGLMILPGDATIACVNLDARLASFPREPPIVELSEDQVHRLEAALGNLGKE